MLHWFAVSRHFLRHLGPLRTGPAGGLSSGRDLRFAPGRPGCVFGCRGPASGPDRPADHGRGPDHAAEYVGRPAGQVPAGASRSPTDRFCPSLLPAARWPMFMPIRPMAAPSITAAHRPPSPLPATRPGACVSALAAGVQRYLGGTVLRLCAAADWPREDLDQSARLHLQTDLRLAADGKPATGPAGCRSGSPAAGVRRPICERPARPRRPKRSLHRRPRRGRRFRYPRMPMPGRRRGPIQTRRSRTRR